MKNQNKVMSRTFVFKNPRQARKQLDQYHDKFENLYKVFGTINEELARKTRRK